MNRRKPNEALYANAMRDAAIILGPRHEQDPLAWWCLVELLVSYGRGLKS